MPLANSCFRQTYPYRLGVAIDGSAARQHAEQRARDAEAALHDERRAAAARIAEAEEAVTAARAEREAPRPPPGKPVGAPVPSAVTAGAEG